MAQLANNMMTCVFYHGFSLDCCCDFGWVCGDEDGGCVGGRKVERKIWCGKVHNKSDGKRHMSPCYWLIVSRQRSVLKN
jgi:hypothetical protein